MKNNQNMFLVALHVVWRKKNLGVSLLSESLMGPVGMRYQFLHS